MHLEKHGRDFWLHYISSISMLLVLPLHRSWLPEEKEGHQSSFHVAFIPHRHSSTCEYESQKLNGQNFVIVSKLLLVFDFENFEKKVSLFCSEAVQVRINTHDVWIWPLILVVSASLLFCFNCVPCFFFLSVL